MDWRPTWHCFEGLSVSSQGSDPRISHPDIDPDQRILYFRQLQEISDSVAEVGPDDGRTVEESIDDCLTEQNRLGAKIKTGKARQRYLDNLAENQGDEEDEDTCILCRCEFARGFITQCAHVFCEVRFQPVQLRTET